MECNVVKLISEYVESDMPSSDEISTVLKVLLSPEQFSRMDELHKERRRKRAQAREMFFGKDVVNTDWDSHPVTAPPR